MLEEELNDSYWGFWSKRKNLFPKESLLAARCEARLKYLVDMLSTRGAVVIYDLTVCFYPGVLTVTTPVAALDTVEISNPCRDFFLSLNRGQLIVHCTYPDDSNEEIVQRLQKYPVIRLPTENLAYGINLIRCSHREGWAAASTLIFEEREPSAKSPPHIS